jgi:hypothetical protein
MHNHIDPGRRLPRQLAIGNVALYNPGPLCSLTQDGDQIVRPPDRKIVYDPHQMSMSDVRRAIRLRPMKPQPPVTEIAFPPRIRALFCNNGVVELRIPVRPSPKPSCKPM